MYWEQNKNDLTSILVTLIFPTCLLRSFGTTNRHLVQTLFFRLIRIAIFYWHYCPKCEGAIASTETGDTSFDSPRVQSEYLPSKKSAWSVSFFWIGDSWRFWNNMGLLWIKGIRVWQWWGSIQPGHTYWYWKNGFNISTLLTTAELVTSQCGFFLNFWGYWLQKYLAMLMRQTTHNALNQNKCWKVLTSIFAFLFCKNRSTSSLIM